jgi:ribulose-5-phosphate 4-epimerase/fuculose-1-phosphate aldolase
VPLSNSAVWKGETVYESARNEVVSVVDDLIRFDYLECNGGAVAVRLPDGNIMMTPTGAAVRRWRLEPDDLVVMTPTGDVVERGDHPSAASTLQVLLLFEAFPAANAIIHTHAQWSLAYATAGVSIPPAITSFDRYGDVPCILFRDGEFKARFKSDPWPVPMPAAMLSSRPDVAAVGQAIAGEAIERLLPRAAELGAHGLAFTMYRHGLVVFAGSLTRAVQDVTAIEANARAAWRASAVRAAHEASAISAVGVS